jgi:hypothetical protein
LLLSIPRVVWVNFDDVTPAGFETKPPDLVTIGFEVFYSDYLTGLDACGVADDGGCLDLCS